MDAQGIKNPVNNERGAKVDQDMKEVLGSIEDDVSNSFHMKRQVVHEYNSPAMLALRKYGRTIDKQEADVNAIAETEDKGGDEQVHDVLLDIEKTQALRQDRFDRLGPEEKEWVRRRLEAQDPGSIDKVSVDELLDRIENKQGELQQRLATWSPEEMEWLKGRLESQGPESGDRLTVYDIVDQMVPLQDPWIDPVTAFASAFGAGGIQAVNAGLKLMPSLGRAITTGVVSGIADYPVGATIEPLAEKYPRLAFPLAILVGMVSGAMVESRIEKAVIKSLSKKGVNIKNTPEVIKKEVRRVTENLEAGRVEDEATAMVVKKLNDEFAFKTPSPEEFIKARNKSKLPEMLTPYTKEELSGFDIYLTNKGVGYALTPEKDLINVFNNSGVRGAGEEAVIDAIVRGAKTLDCYGHFLKKYYEKFGFKVYKIEPWNDEYAPKNWNFTKHGKPDIFYMRYEGGSRDPDTIRRRLKDLRRPGTPRYSPGAGNAPRVDEGYYRGEGRGLGKGEPGSAPQPVGLRPESRILNLEPAPQEKAAQFLQADISDLPHKAININFERIESPDDVKKVIAATADIYRPEIQKARRGTQSNEATERLADLIGMSPETLLKRRKGQAFNAEEATAARKILVSSAERLVGLAKKVKTLEATDADRFAFQKHLSLHYAIQAQVSGMTAEAGRALQSFKIMAAPSAIQTRQIKEFLENMPAGMSTEKIADMVSSLDSAQGINKFVREAARAKTSDMFLEAWINGLLSGPQTHAVNTLSNTLVALWQVPERLLASQIGKVTGSHAVKEGEALSQAFGLVEGFKDGLKAFSKVIRTGEPADPLSKIEARRYRAITPENIKQLPIFKMLAPDALEKGGIAARAVDLLGEAIRMPGRFLTAEDELFKSVGYRMELRARAFRQAVDEGLTGMDAARRIQEITNNPMEMAPDIHLAAVDASRYQTFTGPLGEAGKAVQTAANRIPALRLVVPFIRTPTNILKFAGERTPLAFMSKNIRADIAAGGARRDLALARISMGSMIMAASATLAGAGIITGAGPSDPHMQATKRRSGWQPYSILIGDTYYSYGRLEPLGMVLGLAADAAEIMGQLEDEDDRADLATAVVTAISKNVTSKTWLRGLSEAILAIDDPDRYGNRFIQNYVRSAVPTGVAQVERVMDPEMEAVYGYMDAIKSRIPGLSADLPPRRNLWGEPIILGGGLGPDIVSPVYTSKAKVSPIDDEILRLRLPISMPRRTESLEGVSLELSPEEYDRFLVLMNTIPLNSTGKTLKQSLDSLVTSDPEYNRLTDGQKELRIRHYILEAKDLAKRELLYEFPDLRRLVDYGHDQRAMGNQ